MPRRSVSCGCLTPTSVIRTFETCFRLTGIAFQPMCTLGAHAVDVDLGHHPRQSRERQEID